MTLLRRYRWLGGTFALLLFTWQAAATFRHVHLDSSVGVASVAATRDAIAEVPQHDDDHGGHDRGCDVCAVIQALCAFVTNPAIVIAHSAIAMALHITPTRGTKVTASHRLAFDARGPPRL